MFYVQLGGDVLKLNKSLLMYERSGQIASSHSETGQH